MNDLWYRIVVEYLNYGWVMIHPHQFSLRDEEGYITSIEETVVYVEAWVDGHHDSDWKVVKDGDRLDWDSYD